MPRKAIKTVLGYGLHSVSKVRRIEKKGELSDEKFLTEYDKLGGLITKEEHKVLTGSFYDFTNKKARKEPKVVYDNDWAPPSAPAKKKQKKVVLEEKEEKPVKKEVSEAPKVEAPKAEKSKVKKAKK